MRLNCELLSRTILNVLFCGICICQVEGQNRIMSSRFKNKLKKDKIKQYEMSGITKQIFRFGQQNAETSFYSHKQKLYKLL